MINLIRTLSLNPFLGNHLAALLQTILLIGLIIFPSDYEPVKPKQKVIFKSFKSLGTGIYALFGFLLVDMAVLWLADAWTYVDWKFQLPGVIICLVLGLEYLIYPLLRKPKWTDIIYLVILILSTSLFLHWWIPQFDVMGKRLEGIIFYIIGGLIILYLLMHLLRNIKEYNYLRNEPKPKTKPKLKPKTKTKTNELQKEKDNTLYDISKTFNKIFSKPLNWIFWVLAISQSMLSFYGYSLFYLPV